MSRRIRTDFGAYGSAAAGDLFIRRSIQSIIKMVQNAFLLVTIYIYVFFFLIAAQCNRSWVVSDMDGQTDRFRW